MFCLFITPSPSFSLVQKRKALFSKVVHYMTMGLDMSPVFTKMIMATPPDDVGLKKLLYLYISSYAGRNPELALLTVNTLVKDTEDADPTIRGLALRYLCGLRIPNLAEYALPPVSRGLQDADGYVRRCAAMGVQKLHAVSPEVLVGSDVVPRLEQMLLADPDTDVAANCLHSLEIVLGPGGLVPTKRTVYGLLNRLKQFNEWGQCSVLRFTNSYVPESEQEVFDILNVLEDRMQHANTAIVLAAARVFLNITLSLPAVHQQVLERIRPPLLTLMSSRDPEAIYVVLCHLHALARHAPELFSADYKNFFCKFSDPACVKLLKVDLLRHISGEANAYNIVTELCEYVSDLNVSVSRASVRAVGLIALRCPTAPGILERLLDFLDHDSEEAVAETLKVMVRILRQYPGFAPQCLAALEKIEPERCDAAFDVKARAAYVWILGAHSGAMQEAPYLLESIAQKFEDEPPEVQVELLAACLASFCVRAPESQPCLTLALEKGVQSGDREVKDRALFTGRLLKSGMPQVQQFVERVKAGVMTAPVESKENEAGGELRGFDTLAVVECDPTYRVDAFDDEPPPPPPPIPTFSGGVGPATTATPAALGEADFLGGDHAQPAQPAAGAGPPQGDFFSLSPEPAAPAATPAATGEGGGGGGGDDFQLNLASDATIDAGTFQQIWGAQAGSEIVQQVGLAPGMCDVENIKQALLPNNVFTLATGPGKLFCFARQGHGGMYFLLELLLNPAAQQLNMTLRTDQQGPGADMVAMIVLACLS